MGDTGTVPGAPVNCPGTNSQEAGKASACDGCPNQKICASKPTGPDPDLAAIAHRLADVKNIVLVLSGKGGVGKSVRRCRSDSLACTLACTLACSFAPSPCSCLTRASSSFAPPRQTVSTQLALSLAAKGAEVGLLDIDICGPSTPRMLGLENEEIHQSASGWQPVYYHENLAVMSIGFMLSKPDDAIVWRGPKKTAIIKSFLKDVEWGQLDYLVVDSPPGTSDEHISIVQYLLHCQNLSGAVIVTTSQEVSLVDVRKEINFAFKTELPILGVVSNMAGFTVDTETLRYSDAAGNDISEAVKDLLKGTFGEGLRAEGQVGT